MNPSPILVFGLILLATGCSAALAATSHHVYFGTYSSAAGKGIYRASFDAATGQLSPAELAVEARDPAFLAVHPGGDYLYALDERSDPGRDPSAGLAAYAVDRRTGALRLLNRQSAGGSGPCHLAVDASGRLLLVANYAGGSSAVAPIGVDGSLMGPARAIQHAGRSVNPKRQTAPHAHGIYPSPDNRHALVPDLGIDQVLVYRVDAAGPALAPESPAGIALPPGSGPRHLAFHPSGRYAYVINELACTLTVFRWGQGRLESLQSLPTLPPGEAQRPEYSTAEVVAHPGGRFVYGSNRGHNTIVAYTVDGVTGRLALAGHTPTGGRTPRHFTLDPTGGWMLVENQDSNSVVVFKVDAATGALAPTGQVREVPSPVCAVFVGAR